MQRSDGTSRRSVTRVLLQGTRRRHYTISTLIFTTDSERQGTLISPLSCVHTYVYAKDIAWLPPVGHGITPMQ